MSTIAARLKESTRDAHNSAEGNNFQKEMFSGTLPLPQYRHYLGQLFLVHQALEQGMEKQPYMSAVVTEEQFQTDFLRRDLVALEKLEDDVKPLPSTKEMLSKIEKANTDEPVALLGYHYVLLGSKHGGKMIAAVIKKHTLCQAMALFTSILMVRSSSNIGNTSSTASMNSV